MLVIYLFCKHKHIRTIVASLILHKAKEVEVKLTTETNNPECCTLAYIGMALTILSMATVISYMIGNQNFVEDIGSQTS